MIPAAQGAGLALDAPVDLGARRGSHLLRLLLRDRAACAGLFMAALLLLAAALGPAIATHDPLRIDTPNRYAGPSLSHPLGTDYLGRDTFSRMLHGARLSIGAAVIATMLITVIGVVVGMIAAYIGGLVDAVVVWLIDILLAIPGLLLALAVTALLGPGLRNVVISVVAVWWVGPARLVRSAVLAERELPYLEACRSAGASSPRILARHLLPNILGPIVVLASLEMGAILLAVSTLSFLGLGVAAPTPEWGSMLTDGKAYFSLAPELMIYPGLAIFLFVMSFNLMGDGLRDCLDPTTRRAK